MNITLTPSANPWLVLVFVGEKPFSDIWFREWSFFTVVMT